MFSLKFCRTRGFVPNTLFLKGFEGLGIYLNIYIYIYVFVYICMFVPVLGIDDCDHCN